MRRSARKRRRRRAPEPGGALGARGDLQIVDDPVRQGERPRSFLAVGSPYSAADWFAEIVRGGRRAGREAVDDARLAGFALAHGFDFGDALGMLEHGVVERFHTVGGVEYGFSEGLDRAGAAAVWSALKRML